MFNICKLEILLLKSLWTLVKSFHVLRLLWWFLPNLEILIPCLFKSRELDMLISLFPPGLKISMAPGKKSTNDTWEWHGNNPMIFQNVSININRLLVYSWKVNKLPPRYKLIKGQLSFWNVVSCISISHSPSHLKSVVIAIFVCYLSVWSWKCSCY